MGHTSFRTEKEINFRVGVALTPLGLYLFYKGYQHMQARKMLSN